MCGSVVNLRRHTKPNFVVVRQNQRAYTTRKMTATIHRTLWLALCFAVLLRSPADAAVSLSQTRDFGNPEIVPGPDGLIRVALEGCEPDVRTAKPVLPVAGVTFDIPPGYDVAHVTLQPHDVREHALDAPVLWGQQARSPDEPHFPPVPADPAVYGADTPYPDADAPDWRTDPTDGGTRLSVAVHPVRYAPASGRLLIARAITVSVELRPAPAPEPPTRGSLATDFSIPPLDPDTPCTYLVLSTSNLIHNAPAPWNLHTLCEARAQAGLIPRIIPVEWVYANYPGNNNPERIRAFVQDAHARWGVRHLLIAGTFDLIPVQKLYVSFTDFFSTRTAEIPADAIYYGCMGGGMLDGNGNGRYGEVTDGPNGGDIDLTAEVMVGRFPVANADELAHMVRKTLRYEASSATDLAPSAFMAEKMDLSPQLVYADGFMEEIRRGSTAYSINTFGFANATPYDGRFDVSPTLYDSSNGLWNTAQSLDFLNRDLHTVNHLGHGATKICMKISLSNADNQAALRAFTNTMPYFVYSQACSTGGFDTPDCFAEQLVTSTNAAFAAVMNAREGWLFTNAIGGYSHRFHRCFWDAALRGTATRLGEINEQSRSMNLHLVSPTAANYWRYVYYELNLFGDPATPFAAAINPVPPVIAHTPLINTYDTQTAYRVTCTVEPVGIYNPDAITLVWNTPAATQTQHMTQVSGNLYEAFIPPHPANTRLAYAIRAENHAGDATRFPADDDLVFHVTERLDLDIRGSPFSLGVPDPAYGISHYPSGITVTATAPVVVPASDQTRFVNTGFFGAGSLPQSGTNSTITFRIDTHSLLVWTWRREHLLALCADTAAFPTQTFWAVENQPFAVPAVPAEVTDSNGGTQAFSEWRLDGTRVPPAPGYCAPDFGPLVVTAPHTLEARYLPADLDADANGIPDWWEFRYYGANGNDPDADADLDGYTLAEEYADRSSPLDPACVPAAPVISHTPLAETQHAPGPFTLTAAITDTHAVHAATLRWRRRTDPWQDTPMTSLSNSLFTAQLAVVCAPGDDFEYRIVATDPSGNTSATPVYYTFLVYPVADTSRFHDLAFAALPTQTLVGTYMNLHNTGNADLVWSTRLARVESVTSPDLRTWNTNSLGQLWRASTNRFASPPYALYSRLVSGGLSTSPAVRASITLPPLLIGPNATLSFNYWIHSEPYQSTTRAFDGGIVEYSKDNGLTFQQLKGPYTHTIYGWTYSPWPEGTPCLAGNGTEGWRTATFDLAKEHPEENGFEDRSIIFRFHYGGDNNTDNEGWYIDDVTVSPLLLRPGFASSIDSPSPYTIPAGQNRRIFWYNIPSALDLRDDSLTVFLHSNDPAAPVASFLWQLKIRDFPSVTGLSAAQSAAGDGLVNLSAALNDADGEPLDLSLHWSRDNGKTWQPAPLTNLTSALCALPAAAPGGTLTNLPTAASGALLTNTLAAAWATRLAEPALAVSTQTLLRVTADNGFFAKTFLTAPFPVDNVPPAFLPGALSAAPLSPNGPYAVTGGPLALIWPAASDAPFTNLTYRLEAPAATNATPATAADLDLAAHLDATHTFRVTALDAAGNASAPLTLTLLVLDPAADYDRDGMTTADEETAGTSAADPAARFVVALDAATQALAWQSAPGRLYTVEATPSLQPADWQPLPGLTDIPGTGETLTIPLPAGQPSLFLRLRVRLP